MYNVVNKSFSDIHALYTCYNMHIEIINKKHEQKNIKEFSEYNEEIL